MKTGFLKYQEMDRNVRIKKTVYNKQQSNSILDRKFNTYLQLAEEEDTVTVEDFFIHYEDLYYEIPVKGDINSHEYIIRRSSELVDVEDDNTDIQPLLDEISQLRSQLINYQQQIVTLQQENTELVNKLNKIG